MADRPVQGGLKVTQHLGVGGLAHDVGKDGGHVGELGWIALAMKELRCHRKVALLGEPAADILDVLMHAENFMHDHHRGQAFFTRRLGHVGGNRACLGGNAHHGGIQALGVGGDGLCLQGTGGRHGRGKARQGRGL